LLSYNKINNRSVLVDTGEGNGSLFKWTSYMVEDYWKKTCLLNHGVVEQEGRRTQGNKSMEFINEGSHRPIAHNISDIGRAEKEKEMRK